MPDDIDSAFCSVKLHLLPHSRREFLTSCSCPDSINPCKHIAGVTYRLASALDQDPLVLFELRGLSGQEYVDHYAKRHEPDSIESPPVVIGDKAPAAA